MPYGIINTWPILNKSVVRLFNLRISFTVVLKLRAIRHKLSPALTTYIVGDACTFEAGIKSCWPIDNILLVKLFKFFIASTVVPYLFAIAYNVSPALTIYVWLVDGCALGISNCWPTLNKSLDKPFKVLIAFTVVPYSLEILHKLSPGWTVYMIVPSAISEFGAVYGKPLYCVTALTTASAYFS